MATPAKYRVLDGTLHVVPPGEENAIERPVRLIYDVEQKAVGVMFIGKGELRGYAVYILKDDLERVERIGRPVEKLEIPT